MQQISFARTFLSNKNFQAWLLSGIALVIGLILTLASHFRLCSQACAEGHNWTLFGLPFETTGIVFFLALIILHALSQKERLYGYGEQLLLASALGAESYFIYVQKAKIGQWCPVCLGIATCITIAFISFSYWLIHSSKETRINKNPVSKPSSNLSSFFSGDPMNMKFKPLPSFSALVIGLIVAIYGVSQVDPLHAAELQLKEELLFGNKSSPIEAYLFTDWACPACRKLEENLDPLMGVLTPQAKFYFVDHVIHPETLNFIPYNLSFMIHNKPQYLKLRHMLTDISKNTGSPSEQQIESSATQLGVKYQELHYADIATATKYFKALADKFKVNGTPTLVLINTSSKKGKKLVGNDEITEKEIKQAVQELQ